MKKSLAASVIATAVVLGSMSTQAMAATTHHNIQTKVFSLNGKQISYAMGLVDSTGGTPTTYVSLYYLQQIMHLLGFTDSWDGSNWRLTTPQGTHLDMSGLPIGHGNGAIYVNGTLVAGANRIVDTPGPNAEPTTFMSLWYLEQVLHHLGIKDSWDGTNWAITSTASAGVTQQSMANSLWNTFNSVSWDVVSHPTIDQVGITPSTQMVTAQDVATWISQWAAQAKGVTATWGPNQGKFVPYSLQYEVSQDPYTWASANGLWQQTGVAGPSSFVAPADVPTILSNLQWWLTGDRVVNGVHHLHVPFYSNYMEWYTEVNGNHISQANYQSVLAEVTRVYDQITVTQSGTTLKITLPNTASTQNKLAWDVVDGYWEYGGWQAADNKGGKTISVPNSNTAALGISLATLIPNFYLNGYTVGYKNSNSVPQFSKPVSTLADQSW